MNREGAGVRVAYLDCVGGISGDMFVGALLDAGWSEHRLRESVAWLEPEIAVLRVERRMHHALAGLGIVVEPREPHEHHEHREPHGPHDPRGAHGHARVPHRGLREVTACLEAAPLAPEVRRRCLAVFEALARAEAQAHGASIDTVHFHEVGAVDAMVDIVATCQGLADLGVERLHVSPLPVGRGVIGAAHGRIPLPAPATAHLLRGAPVRWSTGEGERTTPTGAALVTTLGVWEPPPPMTLVAVGTGAGSRELSEVPNLARLFVGDPGIGESQGVGDSPHWGWGEPAADEPSGRWRRVVCMETQVDDASAEQIAYWAEQLLAAGARDVLLTSVMMKKGRPGTMLTVVADPEAEMRLMAWLLDRTSTLGVRRRTELRRELERVDHTVDTRFGPVPVKWARRGRGWEAKPEFEACRAIAQRVGVPLDEVQRAARAAAQGREPVEDG